MKSTGQQITKAQKTSPKSITRFKKKNDTYSQNLRIILLKKFLQEMIQNHQLVLFWRN